MNKKLLYASILFFTGMMITVGYTNAQVCVPDPQYTQPGIYPDSITNLDSGMVGVPYQQIITLVVPIDTTIEFPAGSGSFVDFWIDSIVLLNITNLPPVLAYACAPSSCGFPGGTNGCVMISGTPTTADTYNLDVYARVYVRDKLFNIAATQDDTISYYFIVVSPDVCPPPVADFTVTTSNLTADFTDASTTTGTTTWVWDFGDGSPVDSTQNPSHAYTTDSTYNVCLTVTDSCGNATYCDSVTVTTGGCSAPTAGFTFTTSNLTATFTDASAGADLSWAWDFGDGSPVNNTQDPSHTYTTDSTYNVCLTVTDSCGNATYCDSVTVTGTPCTLSIDTILSTDETSAGIKDGTATVVVSGGIPPYTYNWSIDTIETTDTTSTIVGLAPGPYSVTITDSAGCEKDAGPVTVGAGPSGIQPFDDLTKRVSVYPNPVVNELYIITSFDEQVIFTIYDIVGKQIKNIIIEGETTRVNTTELAEGMYIYQILSKEGIMLNRGKFNIIK